MSELQDQPIDTSGMRIFIADDNAANVALLQELLEGAGYRDITCIQNPMDLVELVQSRPPDLLLLDLHMPMLNGFEVMAELRPLLKHPTYLPILVVTADATVPAKRRALSFGARDFVTKPIDATEVLLRVRNLLQVRRLQGDLATLVDERTREAEAARAETLECLTHAVEYRSDRSRRHGQRVGRTARLLAEQLGMDREEALCVGQACSLHDVGTIGLADAILHKEGPLDEAEQAAQRRHVEIGAEILRDTRSPALALAAQVARDHHEHWDGSGYPSGVAGERIPVAARIAAVADAFDELTHGLTGEPPVSTEEAMLALRRDAGGRFDPEVVHALALLDHAGLTDAYLPLAA